MIDAKEAAGKFGMVQSRAARKRELAACRLQVVRLLLMSERELRHLRLPEPVVDALLATKSMGRGNARQRQIRYLTRLVDELAAEGMLKE